MDKWIQVEISVSTYYLAGCIGCLYRCIFYSMIDDWGISCEIALRWMSLEMTRSYWWVNFGSGNGLTPNSLETDKPFPDVMITQLQL